MTWGKKELLRQYICAVYIPLELCTLEIIISKRNSNFSTKTVNYKCRRQPMQMPAFMHHCLGKAMTDLAHTASTVSWKHVIRYALDQVPWLFLETSTVSQDEEGPGSITAAITAAEHILIHFLLLFFSFNCQHIIQRSKPAIGRLGLHMQQPWKGSSARNHPAQLFCPALFQTSTHTRMCACMHAYIKRDLFIWFYSFGQWST